MWLDKRVRQSLEPNFKWYMEAVGTDENKIKGWFEQPKGDKTPKELEVTVYDEGGLAEDKGTWSWTEGRPIYFDGSCFNQKAKGYEVAGGAALQIDDEGRITTGGVRPRP